MKLAIWIPVPVVAVALAAAFVLSSSPAGAADFRAGGQVVIPAGDTLRDDLYVCAGKVDIDGVVLGDVTVCGGNINVNGTVTGGFLSVGGSTTIAGSVGRTVRSGGGEIRITGAVGEDLVTGCGRLLLAPEARVGRDLLAGAGEMDLEGDIKRNLVAGGGVLTLAGHVGGDVQARAERSRLQNGAAVDGDFVYTSERSVARAPGAVVAGKIEQRLPAGKAKRGPLSNAIRFIYGWERSIAGLLAIGLLLVLPFPAFSNRVLDTLRGSPGASLVTGLLLLIAIPVVAITAGLVGLLLGGWWLGMSALVLFCACLALGVAMSGAFLGQLMLGRGGTRLVWALLAGLVVLTLPARLPFVGFAIAAIAAVFGLGALAIAAQRSRARPA
jgi:cytoskeletal protein CcmA (bactofilin family)